MARYIDLDDDEIIYCGNDGEYERYNIPTDVPTADVVERKNGDWTDIGGIIRWGCPLCHHAYEIKYNYCPNCGARMEGKDDI